MKQDEIQLADSIWVEFKKYIPQKDHRKLARFLFELFRERAAYSGLQGEETMLEIEGKVHSGRYSRTVAKKETVE